MTALYEVITSCKDGSRAFGVTFDDEAQAKLYCDHMSDLGFIVEPSPVFDTFSTAAAALTCAAAFYKEAIKSWQ